jgi:phage repressor protein C with HTH and peptisase S24 domain
MSIQDPKTKTKQDKAGKQSEQIDKKKQAFDQGLPNNSNTQTGTAHSGYDEKNPKHPGGKQQQQPKVTNQENDITNSEEQNKWAEEPVEERSGGVYSGGDNSNGNSTERTDPEIDSPIPDTERTEKKIPQG